MAGELVEIDPPNRLVFTWTGRTTLLSRPAPRVVITLRAENGGTRVVLRPHHLPDREQRDHHRRGWELYLGRLDVRIRGGDPGPDPNT